MDQARAEQALSSAEDIGGRVKRKGDWYAVYCAVSAVNSAGCVYAIGMSRSDEGTWVATAVLLAVTVGLILYGIRQPVTPRRFVALHTSSMAAWSVLYGVAVIVGGFAFEHDPAWWAPASAATALPFLAAGAATPALSRRAR